jgi:diacylglycerol O-acyltransferase
VRRRVFAVLHLLGAVRHPLRAVRRTAGMWRAAMEDIEVGRHGHVASFNTLIGPRRRLALVQTRLPEVKRAGRAMGATVNDVVLAAVAGGGRALLAHRHEVAPGGVLQVSVPMSTRTATDEPGGNRVTMMLVPVPVDEADARERLRQIATVTRARKQLGRASVNFLLGSDLMPEWLIRWVMDRFMTTEQHMVNLFVTDVTGPDVEMRLAGVRLDDAYPIAPISGNVPIGVAVMSYGDQLNMLVHADPDSCPDLEHFVSGINASFMDLLGQVPSDPRQKVHPTDRR